MATAEINPPLTSMALRSTSRIERLRAVISKTDNETRKASLQAELDRRIADVEALKAALAEV